MGNASQIRRRVGQAVTEKIGVEATNKDAIVKAESELAALPHAADVAQRLIEHGRALALEQLTRNDLYAPRDVADRRSGLVQRSGKIERRRGVAGERRSDSVDDFWRRRCRDLATRTDLGFFARLFDFRRIDLDFRQGLGAWRRADFADGRAQCYCGRRCGDRNNAAGALGASQRFVRPTMPHAPPCHRTNIAVRQQAAASRSGETETSSGYPPSR